MGAVYVDIKMVHFEAMYILLLLLGKNACDGISGTVKREASKASLQATVVGHILTANNLFDWGAGHLLNIKLCFISKEEVSAHVD